MAGDARPETRGRELPPLQLPLIRSLSFSFAPRGLPAKFRWTPLRLLSQCGCARSDFNAGPAVAWCFDLGGMAMRIPPLGFRSIATMFHGHNVIGEITFVTLQWR